VSIEYTGVLFECTGVSIAYTVVLFECTGVSGVLCVYCCVAVLCAEQRYSGDSHRTPGHGISMVFNNN